MPEDGSHSSTGHEAIRDIRTQARIRNRLRRVEAGNLGDCKPVGRGVIELRLDFGPGYRVYFAELADRLILLTAGNKATQQSRYKESPGVLG